MSRDSTAPVMRKFFTLSKLDCIGSPPENFLIWRVWTQTRYHLMIDPTLHTANDSALHNFRVRARRVLRWPLATWKRWREPALARRTRHELAVCAIFREEAPYLHEWLTFHVGIGVSHFYLYNNFSTDNYREVLRPWQDAGYVTLTEWPVETGQVAAYRDCVRRFKYDARWIAFFDIDEFLFSTERQDIRPILAEFAHLPGIEVWQVIFGSNGHQQRPPSVLEAYTRSSPARHLTVKTIANPRQLLQFHIHQFKYYTGQGLDTSGQLVTPAAKPVHDRLRLNHYWSRSIEDLQQKVRRGDCSTTAKRKIKAHLRHEQTLNDQPDFVIQPLARAIHLSKNPVLPVDPV